MKSVLDFAGDVFFIRDAIKSYEAFEDVKRNEDEENDFQALQKFLNDIKGSDGDRQWRGDWYPAMFIREDYFVTFAEELAEDIGAVSATAKWPANHIDWVAAADELRQDYCSVEFANDSYWYRKV